MATYSFLDVHAAIIGPGGAISLGGAGAANADEGISCDKADKNTMTIGADGSGMHSLAGDDSGKVTVRLLKTSPVNQLLALMYAVQKSSSSNWGQNTIAVTDVARGDVYSCKQVAFSKFPNNQWAKLGNTIEWEFDVVQMDPLLGLGLPDVSQGI